jgi:D-serine deaminase-like pyridoxal phosphate-dependent protein
VIHAQRKEMQCSPGTFVFWDKGYGDICKEQPFVPAALVMTRVISLPAPGRICLDMGHKSIAAENDISRRAFFLDDSDLQLVGQSEEHGLVSAPVDHGYNPGDVLYVLPYHICPTVNLYSHVVVVENGNAIGSWQVAAKH